MARSAVDANDDADAEEKTIRQSTTCGGYNLKPRQDLAYHRFTQFCSNDGNKGMFLLHNVGTGKTLTSLQIALTTISKNYATRGINLREKGKIVVVTPTGVFDSAFVTEFQSNITGVESANIKKIANPRQLCVFLQDGDECLTIKYFGRTYTLYNLIYKHVYREVENANMCLVNVNRRYDYDDFKTFVEGSIVIFDEAHRLLRPTVTLSSLCSDMIHHDAMSSCMKYVVMTGTPINKDISDVKTMIAFCVTKPEDRNKILDITGRNYGNIKGIITRQDIKTILLSFIPILITSAYVVITDYVFPDIPPITLSLYSIIVSCIINWVTRTGIIGGGDGGGGRLRTESSSVKLQISRLRELLIEKYGQRGNIGLILKMVNIDNHALKTYMIRMLDLFASLVVTTSGVIDEKKLMMFLDFLNENRNDATALISTVLTGPTICAASVLKSCGSVAQLINSEHIQPLLLSLVSSRNSPLKSNRVTIRTRRRGRARTRGGSLLTNPHTVRILTRTAGVVAEMPLQLLVPYFNKSAKNLINKIPPINIAALATDAKKYTSLYDIATQIEFNAPEYKNHYNITLLESRLNNRDQKDALLPTGRPGRTISVFYPKRLNCKIICTYDEFQIALGTLISGIPLDSTLRVQSVGRIDLTKLNDIFSDAVNPTKYIGNFSPDVVDYKCIQLEMNGRDFSYTQTSSKAANFDPIRKPYMYECMKFKSMLVELLFMRTGYMKCGGDTITQPHFTPHETNQDANEASFVPMTHNHNGKPFILSDFAPRQPGYRYLPIVYSTSDVLGLGLFAGYLKSIGFTYILLHDNMKKDYKESQRLSGYNPKRMYPLESSSDPEEAYNRIMNDVQIQNLQVYPKEAPLCVLISEGQTEGIDFKYNPAIFLMEVPKNCCDAEQLAGRVLRSYPSKLKLYNNPPTDQDQRDKVPEKIVCQLLCGTWTESTLVSRALSLSSSSVLAGLNAATSAAFFLNRHGDAAEAYNGASREEVATAAAATAAAAALASVVYMPRTRKTVSKISKNTPTKQSRAAMKLVQISNPNLQDRLYTFVNQVRAVMDWDMDEYKKQEMDLNIFRKFLKELDEPYDRRNQHLRGLGDLEQSLFCHKNQPQSQNAEMCKEVNTDEFDKIFMNPGDDRVRKELAEYCMNGDMIRQDVRTLRREFNPDICNLNKKYENIMKSATTAAEKTKIKRDWVVEKADLEKIIDKRLSAVRSENAPSAAAKARHVQL